VSQSNTRLARVRTARRPHVSRTGARRAYKKRRLHRRRSEFRSRVSLSTLVYLYSRRRRPSRVRTHRTRIRRGLFREMRCGRAKAGEAPKFKRKFPACRRDQREGQKQGPLVCGTDITSSPAAASVTPPHFSTYIHAASTAKHGRAAEKTALNRQLRIFGSAISPRPRAGRLRSDAPVGASALGALAARRDPPGPHPPSTAPRRILDESFRTGHQQKE